jgi:hypothetical protein
MMTNDDRLQAWESATRIKETTVVEVDQLTYEVVSHHIGVAKADLQEALIEWGTVGDTQSFVQSERMAAVIARLDKLLNRLMPPCPF